MSTVVARALGQDRRVELAMDDRGVHLKIDGERLTDGSSGLPLESFEYPLVDRLGRNVSEDALDLAERVLFTGEKPRCPRCYGPRTWFTVHADGAREVRLSHCWRCHRTVREGDGDE
jgi:ribosomal protein S27AE